MPNLLPPFEVDVPLLACDANLVLLKITSGRY